MAHPAASIEKVDNGYIIHTSREIVQRKMVAKTIEEAFHKLLFHLEGRSPHFSGDSYGAVTVHDAEHKKP